MCEHKGAILHALKVSETLYLHSLFVYSGWG